MDSRGTQQVIKNDRYWGGRQGSEARSRQGEVDWSEETGAEEKRSRRKNSD